MHQDEAYKLLLEFVRKYAQHPGFDRTMVAIDARDLLKQIGESHGE